MRQHLMDVISSVLDRRHPLLSRLNTISFASQSIISRPFLFSSIYVCPQLSFPFLSLSVHSHPRLNRRHPLLHRRAIEVGRPPDNFPLCVPFVKVEPMHRDLLLLWIALQNVGDVAFVVDLVVDDVFATKASKRKPIAQWLGEREE